MPVLRSVKRSLSSLDTVDAIEWARLAMAIDGEGHISILKTPAFVSSDGYVRSDRHHLAVRVTNTDIRLLSWCRDTFGGGIYSVATNGGKQQIGFINAW